MAGQMGSIAEYLLVDMANGELFIGVKIDGEWSGRLGPFESEDERDRALADLMEMCRQLGATDLPDKPQ